MTASALSQPDDARPYGYTERDFARVRTLIHEGAGIALADSKRDMVYSRLSRRLRATGAQSFKHYLDALEQGMKRGGQRDVRFDGGAGSGAGGETGSETEWEAFINALTTNLTAFFREAHHFDILRAHLAAQSGPTQPLLIWCAAASTGEEAWSIAMSAVEAFDSPTPPVRILATDIDTQVLEQARRGIYTLERIETLSAERRRRFFRRGIDANQGYCRVDDTLRALVTFRPFNLLRAQWPLHGPFTAIFCRNVMIYFDKATQYRILQKTVPLLAADGRFFAGHSESFFHAADLVTACGRTVYRAADRHPA